MNISDIGAFAIDMDGTVYKGGSPIPGAAGFISRLRRAGIPFVFLTNNSAHARSFYADKLARMGFDASAGDILTSTAAAIRFLQTERPGMSVFPLAVPEVEAEIEEAGIRLDRSGPDIVLLAFDTSITYEKINAAYHHILGGAELIATHPDELCPTEGSYDVDIGPFIRMFESLTGAKALVIGKPDRRMLEMAALETGVPVERLAMVGDRMYTDVRMAVDAGATSILVLSGEAKPEDIASSGIEPDFVASSVADLSDMVEAASD
ncbi:MAG: HAD-IIA family hydrolase [Candidatus Methanoplasma sp.]|jgi:HAD superfamily hydrolase (TIGR01450 family)|nr:HAD-IIA family hydrolase [Candidatus Methanoplasma sp.]